MNDQVPILEMQVPINRLYWCSNDDCVSTDRQIAVQVLRVGQFVDLPVLRCLTCGHEATSDATFIEARPVQLRQGSPGATIDGDLVWEAVVNACPAMISREGSRALAWSTLNGLARMPGVTLLRGPDSAVWTPEDPSAPLVADDSGDER